MLYFTRWKALAIILTALVVCLCAVPNFFPEATVKTWPLWAQRHLVLGLDLQGGSYLLLEVDSNYVKKDKLDQVRDDVRRALRDAKIPYTGPRCPQRQCRGAHHQGHRCADRADQTARAVAAARRLARLQRPAQPRSQRCRRRLDPADRAAGRDHRAHPADGRTVDPDRRTPRQRTRHRRAADPASGHRSHPGAGAGPAGSDAAEGIARQDRQDGIPHGRSRRCRRTRPQQGRAAAGFRIAAELDLAEDRLMSSRSRCWSPAAI